MEWMQIIRERRSIGKVKPDPVPAPIIEKLLEAATWAPNHHRTEPWRFWVMTGQGRLVLGRVYADVAEETFGDVSQEEREEKRRKQEEKALRAPVVIAVAAVFSNEDPIVRKEELAATAAAAQNILLTAHSLGLGAIWRTGAPFYHPKMKQAFGLREQDEMVALIFVGYPDMQAPPAKRTAFEEKTTWLDS